MLNEIDQRLADLKIELPVPPKPAASYVPYIVSGSDVYISGQLPFWDGTLQQEGKVGDDVTLEAAQAAARLCGLNILAVLKEACDDNLQKVLKCIQLRGYVNCTPDFTKQPLVINGASELMGQVFNDRGHHTRAAVGVNALPFNASVEIEAHFFIL